MLREELAKVRNIMEEQQKAHQQEVDDLFEELSKKNERISELEVQLTASFMERPEEEKEEKKPSIAGQIPVDVLYARIEALETQVNSYSSQAAEADSLRQRLDQALTQLEKSEETGRSLSQAVRDSISPRQYQEMMQEKDRNIRLLQEEMEKLEQTIVEVRGEGAFSAWQTMFPECSKASEVREKFDSLLADNEKLKKQITNYQERQAVLQDSVLSLEDEINFLKKELDHMESRMHQKDVEEQTVRLKQELAEQETTSLRNVLKIYSGGNQGNGSGSGSSKEVIALQELVKSKDQEIIKLLDSVEEMREKLTDQETQLSQRRQECAQLKKENEILSVTCKDLEFKVTQKDFDSKKTKVLHFGVNPTTIALASKNAKNDAEALSKAKADLALARDEIRQLRSQLSSTAVSNTQYAKLSQEVQEVNKLNERIKQMFRTKAKEFREAVYLLLGWRIDLASENVYRMQSMYAEHEQDLLTFRYDPDGNSSGSMSLLESDYVASRLDPDLLRFLERTGSIPAFLCALTQQLFEKQTNA
jgi:chromosome segregation ATPase